MGGNRCRQGGRYREAAHRSILLWGDATQIPREKERRRPCLLTTHNCRVTREDCALTTFAFVDRKENIKPRRSSRSQRIESEAHAPEARTNVARPTLPPRPSARRKEVPHGAVPGASL